MVFVLSDALTNATAIALSTALSAHTADPKMTPRANKISSGRTTTGKMQVEVSKTPLVGCEVNAKEMSLKMDYIPVAMGGQIEA